MLTADQRKELEAVADEIVFLRWSEIYDPRRIARMYADRIAAVLANGVEEG